MYLFCSSYACVGDVELTARELYDKILKISKFLGRITQTKAELITVFYFLLRIESFIVMLAVFLFLEHILDLCRSGGYLVLHHTHMMLICSNQ